MTQEELKEFAIQGDPQPVFQISDLANKRPRTLLCGYTSNKNTFHAYLKDDTITRVIYYRNDLEVCIIHDAVWHDINGEI